MRRQRGNSCWERQVCAPSSKSPGNNATERRPLIPGMGFSLDLSPPKRHLDLSLQSDFLENDFSQRSSDLSLPRAMLWHGFLIGPVPIRAKFAFRFASDLSPLIGRIEEFANLWGVPRLCWPELPFSTNHSIYAEPANCDRPGAANDGIDIRCRDAAAPGSPG